MSSRFRGVTWRKKEKCWVAKLQHECINHSFGYFDKEEDAAKQVDRCSSHADIPLSC